MPADYLRLSRLLDLSAENRLITNIGDAETDFTSGGGVDFADDALVRLGDGGDQVFLNRSTALSADTELSNVIVGTSVHPGVAANSLIISNITTDGDIMLAVNDGGNSIGSIHIHGASSNIGFFTTGDANRGVRIVKDWGELDSNGIGLQTVSTIVETTGAVDNTNRGGIFNARIGSTNSQNWSNANALVGLEIQVITIAGGSGTITGAQGLRVLNSSVSGASITTAYGILVEDQTGATNDYGIAIVGADTAALWVSSGADNTDVANGIAFGSSRDTNLFRSAARTLSISASSAGNAYALRAENTENTNAASHAYMESAVGGTSGGDPQFRWTIPSGTSWYAGADNSSNDIFTFGTGTAIGSNVHLAFDPRTTTADIPCIRSGLNAPTLTIASGAASVKPWMRWDSVTLNYTGTTQVTTQGIWHFFQSPTLASDTATLTIDDYATMQMAAPTEGTNVTLTRTTALRIVNASGTPTNQHGIFIEDLTAGGADYGITIAGADTDAIWVQSSDSIRLGTAGTATGRLRWSGATSGTVTMTVAAAAGTWTMTLPPDDGAAGEQLQTDGAGITTWESAASLMRFKELREKLDPKKALNKLVTADVWNFSYKKPTYNKPRMMNTGDYDTVYSGVMGDNFPEIMHHGGKIFSPVSAFGYTTGGIQALYEEIKVLKTQIRQLQSA